MESIIVNISRGGTQPEDATAVTIGSVRWGINGTANFGHSQEVPKGDQELVLYKTTETKVLKQQIDITQAGTVTITVYAYNIHVLYN